MLWCCCTRNYKKVDDIELEEIPGKNPNEVKIDILENQTTVKVKSTWKENLKNCLGKENIKNCCWNIGIWTTGIMGVIGLTLCEWCTSAIFQTHIYDGLYRNDASLINRECNDRMSQIDNWAQQNYKKCICWPCC